MSHAVVFRDCFAPNSRGRQLCKIPDEPNLIVTRRPRNLRVSSGLTFTGDMRKRVGAVPVMGVVKADAYGHGARLVGPALERHGIDWLAVALVEEGLELRDAGVKLPLNSVPSASATLS